MTTHLRLIACFCSLYSGGWTHSVPAPHRFVSIHSCLNFPRDVGAFLLGPQNHLEAVLHGLPIVVVTQLDQVRHAVLAGVLDLPFSQEI